MEVCKFTPSEIDEAIEGLNGLQEIVVPILSAINNNGLLRIREEDIQQFKKHIQMAKHALIAMGTFMEGESDAE